MGFDQRSGDAAEWAAVRRRRSVLTHRMAVDIR